MIVDARLRVHHPCPYCDLSVEFPRSLLLLWCDNRRDVFLLSAPDEPELGALLRTVRNRFHGRVLLREGSDAIVVLPEFEWATPPSVTGIARRLGIFVLPPVLYSDGRETYRVLAPTRESLRRFVWPLRRLGDVELLSVTHRTGLGTVRDVPLGSMHFLEGLTDRQARSLLRAHDDGLLDVPARSRWSDSARREGLSRSTFGEHLRKGQWRLLANAYASLRARVDQATTPVLLKRVGASRGPSRRASARRGGGNRTSRGR